MDFTFDDQQLAFRDAIRKFLMVEAAPEWLREIWETRSGRSLDLRTKLADQGLTAISVPEPHGGMGLGDLDWVLAQQELGYYAIPDSLNDTAYLAVDLLKRLPAGHALAAQWLPRIAQGTARIAIAHPVNPFTADAENADLLLLWHEDEIHALKPAQAKLTLNESIDMSRRLYRIDWTPTASSRVCDASAGRAIWEDLLNRAGLALAAQLVGLASRMLDLGIDHSVNRKQFGKPVGSFQAVKHHMADVAVKIEFARPVVYRAAYAMQKGQADRAVHVSHARLAAGEAARLAARRSIQVHGAMGYTWEADLQMFMKRAWALEANWGDRSFHKARVAAHVLDPVAELGPAHTF
ncbi:alkylation response protein AidB-like acyl-CoA dehydrogenase [Panacagrimonas perspica]|uniref:Alkylation response protein AidB-like acyl-CoA dehydrogenase n=1 Tax=Panacagrimonas perspica TaxID=381431 RepID=A0A4V3F624_9GAMM|nr:acyl-CoA dehydrogenase family protein [Panacagrimonas perspica]TDU31136.1 alkylation response protein AidB-like acyl-CoA dehydrogenase [Panacagrimonas perspica]THD01731.1 acyl-CoA dehydrogenase [Panacagrimonas perspica]